MWGPAAVTSHMSDPWDHHYQCENGAGRKHPERWHLVWDVWQMYGVYTFQMCRLRGNAPLPVEDWASGRRTPPPPLEPSQDILFYAAASVWRQTKLTVALIITGGHFKEGVGALWTADSQRPIRASHCGKIQQKQTLTAVSLTFILKISIIKNWCLFHRKLKKKKNGPSFI